MNKTLITLSLLFTGAFAYAEPAKLLNCATPFGPDQSVVVQMDGTQLLLIETSPHGIEKRALTAQEWNSRVLHLREEDGYHTTLTIEREGDVTLHVTDGAGYNEFGPADCDPIR